ncbi:MAG: DUF3822 family protein [Flammeovirgaceae bacterium]|nr:MAG: DUF3822 family protein [Flammeovirgaceae bacterium]
MQTSTAQYKLIKKIKDERFDEENIHLYHLLINIGSRDFQTLIVEHTDNRALYLEDYVLPSVGSPSDLLAVLDNLFDSHALLQAGFWKSITIAFKNQKFVQVPQALFVDTSLSEYLRFNAKPDTDTEELLYAVLPQSQAVTVFAVPKNLKGWLESVYANNKPVYTHQSAALIEATLHHAKKRQDNPLYIYVDRFKLHILSVQDNALRFYNQFAIQNFSDYVKYIMLVMKLLGMDQKTSEVLLWGYIGKNSPHYHEFYKYINNVTYGGRPDFLRFGYLFDEIQDQHFLDLYGIYLCRQG